MCVALITDIEENSTQFSSSIGCSFGALRIQLLMAVARSRGTANIPRRTTDRDFGCSFGGRRFMTRPPVRCFDGSASPPPLSGAI